MSRADVRRALTVLAVALIALVAAGQPAWAAPLDWYRVSNLRTGKCIDNYARTNNVHQYACGTGANQLWTWYQVPGRPDAWYIENMPYYGCMETTGGGNSAGIVLRECQSGRTSSMWRWVHLSNGWYAIVNVASGRCIDVPNGATGDVRLVQYDCHHGNSQRWKGEKRYTG